MPKCEICGIVDEFVEQCNKYNEPHCLLCHLEIEEKGLPILLKQEDASVVAFSSEDVQRDESVQTTGNITPNFLPRLAVANGDTIKA